VRIKCHSRVAIITFSINVSSCGSISHAFVRRRVQTCMLRRAFYAVYIIYTTQHAVLWVPVNQDLILAFINLLCCVQSYPMKSEYRKSFLFLTSADCKQKNQVTILGYVGKYKKIMFTNFYEINIRIIIYIYLYYTKIYV